MQNIPIDPAEPLTPEFIEREKQRIDELEHRPNARNVYCDARDSTFRAMLDAEAQPPEAWIIVPPASRDEERIRVHCNTRDPLLYRLKTIHCKTDAKVVANALVNNSSIARILWDGSQIRYCHELEAFEESKMKIVDMVVTTNTWTMVKPRRLLGLFWHREEPSKRTNLFIWCSVSHRKATATPQSIVDAHGWYGILLRALPKSVPEEPTMCEVTIYMRLDFCPSPGGSMASLVRDRFRRCILEWEAL